jgi:hypothetical protein
MTLRWAPERRRTGEHHDRLIGRIRSEFHEMPGLTLTPAQAARLWSLDRATSTRILEDLASAGFLCRTRRGAYLRAMHDAY